MQSSSQFTVYSSVYSPEFTVCRQRVLGSSQGSSMQRGAVYVNGKIAPADQAVVPVYDHGFVYGEGVYETLRTYNRVPFLYDRHMQRLRQSAERLLLDVPFDDATLLQWIDQTIAAAGDLAEA